MPKCSNILCEICNIRSIVVFDSSLDDPNIICICEKCKLEIKKTKKLIEELK